MGKALVIVESPSKAKIINGYLGDNYIVKASVGHIRDLPASATSTRSKKATSSSALTAAEAAAIAGAAEGEELDLTASAATSAGAAATKAATKTTTKKRTKKSEADKVDAQFARMGVDPRNGWKANYEIMPDKVAVVNELKRIAKDCDEIYLATDLDREGEAIAWHLREVLSPKRGDPKPFWRVKYPEITKAAIAKAFANPGQINMDLVNAQQTRRFLDRVVGFMLSPLLWEKVGRGLSAGRVQSVAVELIVEREREIKAFVPQEYWTIASNTQTPAPDCEPLALALATKGKNKVVINNATEAAAIVKELSSLPFVVEKIESKRGTAHAPAPFTTSTLQQTANQRLGFSVKRTMVVAQRLYESGFITYMRTDSVNLSQEAIESARNIIMSKFGAAFMPEKPNFYHSKESAQEAHEAIRPSHPDMKSLPSTLDRDAQRLYQLIYDRYVACQMSDQIYETRSITVRAGDYRLRASGRTEIFAGFRALIPAAKGDEVKLPLNIKEGDVLTVNDILPSRHFTQPPARYSEATLVKELEKDGIGRPSTYASIIATIQDRGYVKVERNRFFATKMGEIVTDRLRYSFSNLMDYSFTASMEESLDEIAAGTRNWLQSLDEFYADFSTNLAKAQLPYEQGGMPNNRAIEINMPCPQCGKYHMAIHSGRTGSFLSCMGYQDPKVKAKERCKCTINLVPIEQHKIPEDQEMDAALEAALLLESKRCPKCQAKMDAFLIDAHRKLYVCSNSPLCDGYVLEEGDFSKEAKEALGPTITCEKCGHEMVRKEGRFGQYMKCTNDACGNTRKILKNGEVAPPREDPVDMPELICEKHPESHYVLRDSANGIFLAAHNFPAVRETRPVKVAELRAHRSELSPKFYYLADAPVSDPDGNPTEVRFSRKMRVQYLSSTSADGKATNWAAYYHPETNSWHETTLKSAGSSAKSSGSSSTKSATKSASKSTAKSTTKSTTKSATKSSAKSTKSTTKSTTTRSRTRAKK